MTAPETAPLILFAGDSITDCDRRTDPEGLGDGYVRILAGPLAAEGFRVINTGISGNRAADLRARWQSDVVAEKPDLVSILVGVNEVWRRFDSGDPTSAADFEADYRALLDALPNARLVLIEPFLVPADGEQRTWRAELGEKSAVVRRLAEEYDATLLPADAHLNALGGAPELCPDGVHPNAKGHEAIASLWLERTAALRKTVLRKDLQR